MKKQQKIQITLILIGFLLIFTTYFYYPYTKKIKFAENKTAQKDSLSTSGTDQDTSFVYDLNHNDAAEIVGQFSLYKKGEDDIVTPIPISSFVQEGKIEGIEVKDILLN